MGRLAGRIAQARDAVASVELAIDKDVSKIIDRANEVHARRENITHRHIAELDTHMADLSELEKDLEAFGKNDFGAANDGDAYKGTRKDD